MNDPVPERITVSFNVTADEYAHYAAAVERRSRNWTAFNTFIAVVFCAIPVALLFRWLAAQRLGDPDATEMVGEYSLYAYGLGIIVIWIESSIVTWILRRRYFRTTVDVADPRTAELDHTGVTVRTKGATSSYEWAVVSQCTVERKLLLIWIAPSTAAAIPTRCLGDEAASTAALAFVRARIAEAKARLAQASNAPKPDSNPA